MAQKKNPTRSRAPVNKLSASKRSPRLYENVVFEFPSDDMRGTVIERDDQMVIDIPEQNGLALQEIRQERQVVAGRRRSPSCRERALAGP